MTDYLTVAGDLAYKAPAQAKLLRHMLVYPGQTATQIQTALDITDANFRLLIGKLRDRGIEVVVRRINLDPADHRDVEYQWSIKSGEEVEHWAGGRKGSLRTAWERVEKMMIRHLRNIEDLDPEDRGVIIGALQRVTEDIDRVDMYAQVKIEEAKTARAAEDAEASRQLRIEATSDN